VALAPVLERGSTGEPVLAQKEKQIELTLDLDLALHLIDLDEELALYGLEDVMGIDRSLANGPNR
jgi:hypothetical protein